MSKLSDYLNLNSLAHAEGLFWLQGPGGNTSFKENEVLYIKPSGYRIRQLTSLKNLSQVDLKKFNSFFSKLNSTPAGQVREQNYKASIEQSSLVASLRPSMETGFHAALHLDYVFHIHSLWSLLTTDLFWERQSEFKDWYMKNWAAKLGSMDFIPATMPGAELALEIKKRKDARILFLQNHGAIIQFQEPQDLKTYQSFEKDIANTFFPDKATTFRNVDLQSLSSLRQGPLKFYFPDMAIIYPRLKPFLIPSEDGGFEVDPSIDQKDPDALENWLATQILYQINPKLRELPPEIISLVPHLPTELVRKKVMESK